MSNVVDPLSPEARARELLRPRPRHLPIAPIAAHGARQLPLADTKRAVDAVRPIYAVWEITLACDLACRHCGSRAGHERPDELSTAECLDLCDQLAGLDVKEVTLIGGEAYLRDDWLDIVRRLRQHKIVVTTTSGGRGLTPRAHRRGARRRSRRRQHLARRRRGDSRSPARRQGLVPVGAPRHEDDARAEDACILQYADQSPVGAAHRRRSSRRSPHSASTAGRSSSPCRWDARPTSRTCSCSRTICSRCSPCWRSSRNAATSSACACGRGTTSATSGPTRACSAGTTRAGMAAPAVRVAPPWASKPMAPSRAAPRCRPRPGPGATSATPSWWTSGNAPSRSATRVTVPPRDLWGFCATCYYADECKSGCTWTSFVTLGKPGNNPFCHHRALEMERVGKRERVVKTHEAPGAPFDHGLFTVVVEDR